MCIAASCVICVNGGAVVEGDTKVVVVGIGFEGSIGDTGTILIVTLCGFLRGHKLTCQYAT